MVEWGADMVDNIFLLMDATIIKAILLFMSRPYDRLMWHYPSDGIFSVKSTYHVIRMLNCSSAAFGDPSKVRKFWNSV